MNGLYALYKGEMKLTWYSNWDVLRPKIEPHTEHLVFATTKGLV